MSYAFERFDRTEPSIHQASLRLLEDVHSSLMPTNHIAERSELANMRIEHVHGGDGNTKTVLSHSEAALRREPFRANRAASPESQKERIHTNGERTDRERTDGETIHANWRASMNGSNDAERSRPDAEAPAMQRQAKFDMHCALPPLEIVSAQAAATAGAAMVGDVSTGGQQMAQNKDALEQLEKFVVSLFQRFQLAQRDGDYRELLNAVKHAKALVPEAIYSAAGQLGSKILASPFDLGGDKIGADAY